MNKILKTLSLLIISLFILSLFGWMVNHISQGDKKFGAFGNIIKHMYSFPDLFSQSVEEVKTLPKTFIPTPQNFKAVNNLESDVKILSTYSDKGDRTIVLMNLRNDSVIYKWNIKNPYAEHTRILNPILLPKKSLIFGFDGFSGLIKIDSLTNVIWTQDSIQVHHSMNLDSNGDVWVCTFQPSPYKPATYKLNGRTIYYKDNYITKIDSETGKILFHQSLTNILTENNLSGYLLKSQVIKDPIHLNDIEPALNTSTNFNREDVFISMRNISLVLQYRPSQNKIVKVIEGSFSTQHDVDILNDNTLAIFNNNNYQISSSESKAAPNDLTNLEIAGDFYSNIVNYNLENNKTTFIGDSVFRANKIFTGTEGLVDFINLDTYFIEEQNSGVIWVIEKNKVIYKNVLKSQHEGYHHLTNWIRIIKDYD